MWDLNQIFYVGANTVQKVAREVRRKFINKGCTKLKRSLKQKEKRVTVAKQVVGKPEAEL